MYYFLLLLYRYNIYICFLTLVILVFFSARIGMSANFDLAINFSKKASGQMESAGWTTGKPCPVPKMESAFTSLGDKIYILAGYGETGKRNKNTVEVYDTKTDTWSNASPVPVNLNHAAATSYGNKIYLVGGFLDSKIPSNRIFIYDPSSDSWHEGKSMPTARA